MSDTVRNKIIANLFTSKDFNDCIKKMEPQHLQDELKAEVALILCELPEDFIVSLTEVGIKYYAVRIILNLIKSNTSPFYKKFRQPIFCYNEVFASKNNDEFRIKNISQYSTNEEQDKEDLRLRLTEELKEQKVLNIVENLYWYDKEMLKLYMETGNYREMQKRTGIPWQSCYDTIQTTYAKIRYELRKQPN